ncbi:MAG: YCF48-related protein [Candidatus Cyclobacteriaceae bacterium M3_2C_046]
MKNQLVFALLLLGVAVNAYSQCKIATTYVHPEFTNDYLQDIIFINDSVGYIVGGSTTILKTMDRGHSWEKIPVDFEREDLIIYGITLNPAKDSLFIYGHDLFVTDLEFNQITFISTPTTILDLEIISNGNWLYADNNGNAYLSKSMGDTWQKNAYFSGTCQFDAVNDQVIYAFLPHEYELYKSIDGGNSWGFQHKLTSYYNTMHAVDENTLVLGGDGSVIISTDGGNTWKSRGFDPSYGRVIEMEFEDPEKGYMIVYETKNFSSHLLKTINGGKSWQQIDQFSNGFNQHFKDFHITSDQMIILIGRFGLIVQIDEKDLNWNKYSGKITPLITSTDQAPSGLIYGAANQGQLVKIDPARDFFEVDTLQYEVNFKQVAVVNNDTIFVMADSLLIRTVDGTSQWETIFQNTDSDQLVSIQADETGSVWLGTAGNIWFSSDNGNTFKNVFSLDDSQTRISYAYSLNDSTGFIALEGDKARLLKSTNYGLAWDTVFVSDGKYASITTIKFLNDTLGFISGNNNVLSKSEDGGESWSRMYNNVTNSTGNIEFLDENIGYLVTNYAVLRTGDGGNTWKEIYYDWFQHLEDLVALEKETVLVAGRGGLVLELKTEPDEITYSSYQEEVCLDHQIEITLNPVQGTVYQWFMNGELVSNTAGIRIMPAAPGTQEIKMVRTNACQLTDTILHEVEVLDETRPVIPEITFERDTLFTTASHQVYWYYEESLIEQQHQDYLLTDHYGTYYVIDSNRCAGTRSEKFEYSAITALDLSDNQPYKIYPNPAREQVFVQIRNNQQIESVELLTMSGHLVVQVDHPAGIQWIINSDGIMAGTYLLIIKSNQKVYKNLLLLTDQ